MNWKLDATDKLLPVPHKKKKKSDRCSSESLQNFAANLCNFKTDAKVSTLIRSEVNNWGHNKAGSGGYLKA